MRARLTVTSWRPYTGLTSLLLLLLLLLFILLILLFLLHILSLGKAWLVLTVLITKTPIPSETLPGGNGWHGHGDVLDGCNYEYDHNHNVDYCYMILTLPFIPD